MKLESKAVHFADRKTRQRLRARHHADPHRDDLRLRFDGRARPRFRRRRRRPLLRAATTIPRATRSPTGERTRKRSRRHRLRLRHERAAPGHPGRAARPSQRVVAANALYGATTNLLMSVFGPMGVETTFADICDLAAFEAAVAETKPGAVIMETVSNPLLRVRRWIKSPKSASARACR